MSKRQLIVVDTETTGLIPGRHWPIEVAAVNVVTGEELHFVPALPEGALDHASGEALAINRYFERRLFAQRLAWNGTESRWDDLWEMLAGNTLGGSNPTFDADMIVRGYTSAIHGGFPSGTRPTPKPVWHHRLADLAAYAAGAFRLPPTELVGLGAVCERLGIQNEGEHTALGDARATAECFRKLERLYTYATHSTAQQRG